MPYNANVRRAIVQFQRGGSAEARDGALLADPLAFIAAARWEAERSENRLRCGSLRTYVVEDRDTGELIRHADTRSSGRRARPSPLVVAALAVGARVGQ